jgi:hypothetical protein
MRKMLLAVFLLLPAPVFAGPPEGVSGKMVFDEVAYGLQRYQQETDTNKRIRWLEKLAPTHDPRVAVLLGSEWDMCGNPKWSREGLTSYVLLERYYLPPSFAEPDCNIEIIQDAKGVHIRLRNPALGVGAWWRSSEVDLRRRAILLPE